VSRSSAASQISAAARSNPHISNEGCSPAQQAGRSALAKIAQR
jgi:hypothetical protein